MRDNLEYENVVRSVARGKMFGIYRDKRTARGGTGITTKRYDCDRRAVLRVLSDTVITVIDAHWVVPRFSRA